MEKPYLNEIQRFAVRHNSTLGKFFMVDLKKKIFQREFCKVFNPFKK